MRLVSSLFGSMTVPTGPQLSFIYQIWEREDKVNMWNHDDYVAKAISTNIPGDSGEVDISARLSSLVLGNKCPLGSQRPAVIELSFQLVYFSEIYQYVGIMTPIRNLVIIQRSSLFPQVWSQPRQHFLVMVLGL